MLGDSLDQRGDIAPQFPTVMPVTLNIPGLPQVDIATMADIPVPGGLPPGFAGLPAAVNALAGLPAAVNALAGNVNALAGLPAVVNALAGNVNALAGNVNALAGLPAAVAAIRQDNARAANGSATAGVHVLRPVPDNAGNFPPWFPGTRNALMRNGAANLTLARANALIGFYGLPGGGNLQAKRDRLALYFGVRV